MNSARQSAARLIDESMQFVFPAALRAAAAVQVADHMADGDHSVERLAKVTGTNVRNLRRVLRLLATRGVVEETSKGRFRLTSTGQALRSDAPYSARTAILMHTDPTVWRPAGEILRCLTDGDSAFPGIFGVPFFDYFARDAETAAVFHDGMAAVSDVENGPIAEAYGFPPVGTVIDVGGGHGGLLLEVLRSQPGLRGVLYDQKHVLAGHQLDHQDIASRWSLSEGNFFSSAPQGDIYLIKRILHDWSDEECAAILRNCRKSLAPGGRILVIEPVVPPGNLPHQSKTLDMIMMACLDGRERTESEFVQLLKTAGLRLQRIVSTPTMLSIIEAVPAEETLQL